MKSEGGAALERYRAGEIIDRAARCAKEQYLGTGLEPL
jgi:hypothetical protein